MLMTSSPSSPSSSSTKPTNSTGTATSGERTFSTKRFQVAIFLHAAGKLQFLGCELDENKREVYFTFSDPDGIGDELELDYEGGEAVSAISIFASQKFLRRKMAISLGERDGNGRDVNFNGRDGDKRKENLNHRGVFHNEYHR